MPASQPTPEPTVPDPARRTDPGAGAAGDSASAPSSSASAPSGPADARPTLTRRAAMGGGALLGGGLLALGAAACTDDGDEEENLPEHVTATLVEHPDSRGDFTVWMVSYELEEGESTPPVHHVPTQEARRKALEDKKAEKSWTAADPLLVLDPFGTTTTGLYVFLEGEGTQPVEFTVEAPVTEPFARAAANHAEAGFEGLLMGLVPGADNVLTLQRAAASGGALEGTLRIKAPASQYATTIAADVPDPEALSPGLFALSGVTGQGNNSYLFDASGVMRGELVSADSPQHRVLLQEGRLVLTTGSRQVSVISPLGHADPIIDLGDQSVHHDLVVRDGVAHVLTSRMGQEQVEDRVVRVDLSSGDVDEVVDLRTLFPAYEKAAHRQEGEAGGSTVQGKDWIHINSIDVVDGVMYLSARETSTIIALENALEAGGEPSVRWMIGVEELWDGTEGEGRFLAPEGQVIGNAGQHAVERIDDDSLPEGQFYLEMFNNNYWKLSTRDAADWEDIGPPDASSQERDGVSHVLRYLVDENAGTYRQDEAIEVAYSSVVSNVHRLGEGGLQAPMIVNSGRVDEFTERAADGTVLASYRYDSASLGYRVYKDAFDGFWFTEA